MFPLPVSRHISSGFRDVRYIPHRDVHQGIDIIDPSHAGAIRGEAVFVAHDGYVRRTGWEAGAGWRVTLEYVGLGSINLPIVSRYMHLLYDTTPQAPLHARIKRGTRIGSVGTSGASTGYHLHLDFNNRGITGALGADMAMNPERFFPNTIFTGYSNRIP